MPPTTDSQENTLPGHRHRRRGAAVGIAPEHEDHRPSRGPRLARCGCECKVSEVHLSQVELLPMFMNFLGVTPGADTASRPQPDLACIRRYVEALFPGTGT